MILIEIELENYYYYYYYFSYHTNALTAKFQEGADERGRDLARFVRDCNSIFEQFTVAVAEWAELVVASRAPPRCAPRRLSE